MTVDREGERVAEPELTHHLFHFVLPRQVVRPHPRFRLFATQNPPGAYGGRKPLSRAFRNRFLEIDVGAIPAEEMEQILAQRSGQPPSYCRLLVQVSFQDLDPSEPSTLTPLTLHCDE